MVFILIFFICYFDQPYVYIFITAISDDFFLSSFKLLKIVSLVEFYSNMVTFLLFSVVDLKMCLPILNVTSKRDVISILKSTSLKFFIIYFLIPSILCPLYYIKLRNLLPNIKHSLFYQGLRFSEIANRRRITRRFLVHCSC